MSIFVVGADHLGDITARLKKIGCETLTHLKGRKNMQKRDLQIPSGTDLVLVITDYVDHNIARIIRDKAKTHSIPVVFSKRSWSYLARELEKVKGLG